ncbi:MAG TPA: hypothetical protein VKF15_02305 [Nitrososphaerales archaeon]|nr:hypothetical protein [Nitrososphaerales archaeon]
MSSEDKLAQPESKMNLKRTFSSLIDAMGDAQRMHEREDKVREIEETNKRQVAALEKLPEEITRVMLSLQDRLGKELAGDLEKRVSSLSLVAIDLTRKKIEERYSTEIKDNQLALESERIKAFKSMEAFLATLPFSLLDKSVNLKLLDKVYAANARYNCANNIQFEFSLDCKRSTVLNKEFKLASPEGEIKVPISLGKSRFRRAPTPDYEGLDHYVLSVAEVTEPQLAATYVYPEKSSTISMINSKRDSHASLTVEYLSPETRINITSEPALNRFLDSEQIDKSSEALRQSILELENYKVDLVKLVSDGKTIFEEGRLDVQQFLAKAWEIIEPEVEAVLREGGSVSEGDVASSEREEVLDLTFIRQKIISLGESGNALLVSLKLS